MEGGVGGVQQRPCPAGGEGMGGTLLICTYHSPTPAPRTCGVPPVPPVPPVLVEYQGHVAPRYLDFATTY